MKQYIIPGLFFLGTLFFAVLYVVGPSQGDTALQNRTSKVGTVPYNRLQNLKQQTAVHLDLKKQRALLNKKSDRLMLDPEVHRKNSFHKLDINNDLGPAAEDLNSRRSAGAMSIDQKMDEFLAKKQNLDEMEMAARQTYVDNFIAEALSMGYDIKVNDDMEVVSVKRVPPHQ